jgi:hypothetical protein
MYIHVYCIFFFFCSVHMHLSYLLYCMFIVLHFTACNLSMLMFLGTSHGLLIQTKKKEIRLVYFVMIKSVQEKQVFVWVRNAMVIVGNFCHASLAWEIGQPLPVYPTLSKSFNICQTIH